MHLKSYFANSVQAAMELATRELGPEAMLVSSKRLPAGPYEVVFAEASRTAIPSERPRAVASSGSPGSAPFADIRSELARIRASVTSAGKLKPGIFARRPDCGPMAKDDAKPKSGASPGPAALHNILAALEITGDAAAQIGQALAGFTGTTDAPAHLRSALAAEMGRHIKVDSRLGREGQPPIVALVGPPGRGKTTTLIKLGVRYGIAQRVPLRILSTDTIRIAAADQMRAYAAILGIRFQALDTVASLAQELDRPHSGLTLIDTAGLARTDMADAADLARYFTERSDVDVHLALSVEMKLADIRSAMERYQIFRPSKIVFTGIDETESFGAMYSAASLSAVPVSFLATGQRIPEDIEPATVERIVNLALKGRSEQAQAAA